MAKPRPSQRFEVITQALEKLSQPVKDRADIQHVGTISANGDETVGQMLADAMDKVGKEGDRA